MVWLPLGAPLLPGEVRCCRCDRLADPLIVIRHRGQQIPLCDDCLSDLGDQSDAWASSSRRFAAHDRDGDVVATFYARDLVEAAEIGSKYHGAEGVSDLAVAVRTSASVADLGS